MIPIFNSLIKEQVRIFPHHNYGQCNTLTITVPAAAYIGYGGFLVTRSSICSLHIKVETSTTEINGIDLDVLSTNGGTLTATKSGMTVTIKSNNAWERFWLVLFTGADNGVAALQQVTVNSGSDNRICKL